MKRILSLLLVVCMMTVMIVGCNNTPEETTDTVDTTDTSATTTETTTENTTETTTEMTTTETTTEETTTETTTEETTTEQPKVEEPTIPKSIKILAIGNSFSDDATEHLFGILKDAGVEEVIIGNLYIGGCSIDTHWNNMKNDSAAYEFRYYNNQADRTNTKRSISYALALHEWDYITIQQRTAVSPKPLAISRMRSITSIRKRPMKMLRFIGIPPGHISRTALTTALTITVKTR